MKVGCSLKDKSELVSGWIRKAESDLTTARLIAESEGPYDTACFHTHQAVEKVLKGFLADRGIAIPRSHDLEELASRCMELETSLVLDIVMLAEMSEYAVEMRYDAEFWPDQATADKALKLAEAVFTQVTALVAHTQE